MTIFLQLSWPRWFHFSQFKVWKEDLQRRLVSAKLLQVVKEGGGGCCNFWLPNRKFSKSKRSKYKLNRNWILLTKYTVNKPTVKIRWQSKFSIVHQSNCDNWFYKEWNNSLSRLYRFREWKLSIGPREKRLNDAKLTFQSMKHQRRKINFFSRIR